MIYKNNFDYAYQVYKNKTDFLAGEYSIFYCHGIEHLCSEHSNRTWVINERNGSVSFKIDVKKGSELKLEDAVGVQVNEPPKPFQIVSERAYFYDSKLHKKKSYLIKDDMINILSIDQSKFWCKVQYINNDNAKISGLIECNAIDLN